MGTWPESKMNRRMVELMDPIHVEFDHKTIIDSTENKTILNQHRKNVSLISI